jgi:hypothetical protein
MDPNVPATGLDALAVGVGVPLGAVLAVGVLAGGATVRWAGRASRIGVYAAGAAGMVLNVVVLACTASLPKEVHPAWTVVPAVAAVVSLIGVLLPRVD